MTSLKPDKLKKYQVIDLKLNMFSRNENGLLLSLLPPTGILEVD